MTLRTSLTLVVAWLVLPAWCAAAQAEARPAASAPTAQSPEPGREKPQTQKAAHAPAEPHAGETSTSGQENQERDAPVEPQRDDRPLMAIQPLPPGPRRFRIELGVLPRYNSNLFNATAGAPRRASFITTLAAKLEADLIRGEKSTLMGRLEFHHHFYRDVERADSSDFDVSLEYGFGRHRLALTYFTTPRRLAYIAGDEHVVNRLDGLDLRSSWRVTRRTRTRLGYEFTRENFSTLNERDSDRHKLNGDVRYRIHDLVTPGIGFELGRVTAESTNYNRHEAALVLLLDSRIKNMIWANVRYRYGHQDYTTTTPTAGNFDRHDRRHDLRWQAQVKATDHWWFFVYGSYTTNASSRALRSFTGQEFGAGLFIRFR